MLDILVTWTKIHGKPNASMQETKGFGFLSRLEVGRSMFISGDYGVTTSTVTDVVERPGHVLVTTNNSVYLVEAV
jgi:hypothetical protein